MENKNVGHKRKSIGDINALEHKPIQTESNIKKDESKYLL
jgi:hypothetical protein